MDSLNTFIYTHDGCFLVKALVLDTWISVNYAVCLMVMI